MMSFILSLCLLFAPALYLQSIGGSASIGGKMAMGGGSSCSPTVCGGFTRAQAGCFANASSTAVSCVLGSNLTAGSFLVAFGTGPNTETLTISGCGLTWTQQNQLITSPVGTVATAPNPSGSGACTVTSTGTASGIQFIGVVEINGSVSGLIDQHNLINAGQFAGGARISGTAITTTVANDVVIQITDGYSVTGDTYTAVAPGAIIGQGLNMAFQWQLKTVTGSVNPQIISNKNNEFFMVSNLALEP